MRIIEKPQTPCYTLQNVPKDIYPQIDVKPYTEKLEVLKAAIQENIEKIKIKTESPALPVTLSDIAPILKELASIIMDLHTNRCK